jgi:hypothetical protein
MKEKNKNIIIKDALGVKKNENIKLRIKSIDKSINFRQL